jgi:hypothetical protein
VAVGDEKITGYYTLVVGQIEYGHASERLKKGLARHPVPILLLAVLRSLHPGRAKASAPVF